MPAKSTLSERVSVGLSQRRQLSILQMATSECVFLCVCVLFSDHLLHVRASICKKRDEWRFRVK